MPYDFMTMAAINDELQDAVGARVQRIIQPSAQAVALALYTSGTQRWLVLSTDARTARVAFADEKLAKAFPSPSPFVMLLRKHVDGKRLLRVAQPPYERVLELSFHSDELGEVRVMAEVMARHSNVIVVDYSGRILGALKIVGRQQSSVRPILPGNSYVPPPPRVRDESLYRAGPRIDPFADPRGFKQVLLLAPTETPVEKALFGLLPGASPFLVRQIAVRARVEPEQSISQVDVAELVAAAASIYELPVTHNWQPTLLEDGSRCDFAPYAVVGLPGVRPTDSMSEAVDGCLGREESHDVLAGKRRTTLATLDRAIKSARRRIESLEEGLNAAEAADESRQHGELILAYQHLIAERADRLDIPDLELTIPLDPRLSPHENSERLFKRYRKLRDARQRVPQLLAGAQNELERLTELRTFVALAETEADLAALEQQLGSGPKVEAKPTRKQKRRVGAEYRGYGYTAIAGRNGRENEEVTFRLAHGEDLWMHVRGRAGAHVILRGHDGEPPLEVVEAVAGLAAWLSEGRTDTAADVIVTRVRDVRKVPGPPGRVSFRNERTVRAKPGLGDWRRV